MSLSKPSKTQEEDCDDFSQESDGLTGVTFVSPDTIPSSSSSSSSQTSSSQPLSKEKETPFWSSLTGSSSSSEPKKPVRRQPREPRTRKEAQVKEITDKAKKANKAKRNRGKDEIPSEEEEDSESGKEVKKKKKVEKEKSTELSEVLKLLQSQEEKIKELSNSVKTMPLPTLPSVFNWKTTERAAKDALAIQRVSQGKFSLSEQFCNFVVDTSVEEGKRLSGVSSLSKLLVECILRADRDQSTTEAGRDLQNGASKILKGFSVKAEVLGLLASPHLKVSKLYQNTME